MNRRNFVKSVGISGLGALLGGCASNPNAPTGIFGPAKVTKPTSLFGSADPNTSQVTSSYSNSMLESRCYSKDDMDMIIQKAAQLAKKEQVDAEDSQFLWGITGLVLGGLSDKAASIGSVSRVRAANALQDAAFYKARTEGNRAIALEIANKIGAKVDSLGLVDPYSLNVPMSINNHEYFEMIIEGKKHKAHVGRGYIEISRGLSAPFWQIAACESFPYDLTTKPLKSAATRVGGPFKVGRKFKILALASDKTMDLSIKIYKDGKERDVNNQVALGGLVTEYTSSIPTKIEAVICKNNVPFAKMYIPIEN